MWMGIDSAENRIAASYVVEDGQEVNVAELIFARKR